MYIHYFDESIEKESVNNLIDRLHGIQGEMTLYFSTSGGITSVMKALTTYLNSRKDEITVILTNRIYSAGTFILLDFKGKIKIQELDSILFHIADRETYNFRKDSYSVNHEILIKQDNEYNLKVAKKIKKKGLLTDKQLKDYLKGKDVVVYKEQFSKWKLQ